MRQSVAAGAGTLRDAVVRSDCEMEGSDGVVRQFTWLEAVIAAMPLYCGWNLRGLIRNVLLRLRTDVLVRCRVLSDVLFGTFGELKTVSFVQRACV